MHDSGLNMQPIWLKLSGDLWETNTPRIYEMESCFLILVKKNNSLIYNKRYFLRKKNEYFYTKIKTKNFYSYILGVLVFCQSRVIFSLIRCILCPKSRTP